MNYNIKDAYLKLNKKFILLVTHTPGLKIDSLVNLFTNDLQLHTILFYDNDLTIINNKINSLLDDDSNKMKISPAFLGSAICIIGTTFPSKSLNFNPDLHIHLTLSKTKYYTIFPDKSRDDYDNLSKIILNDKINKYFNIKDINITEDYQIDDNKLDEIFNYIIEFYEKNVYKSKYDMYSTKKDKKNDNIELSDIKDSDSDKLKDTDSDKLKDTNSDQISYIDSDDTDNENLLESINSDFNKIDIGTEMITIPKKLFKKLKQKTNKITTSNPLNPHIKRSKKDSNNNDYKKIDIVTEMVTIPKKLLKKLRKKTNKISSPNPLIPHIKISKNNIFYDNHMKRLKGMKIENHRILNKNIIERTRILNNIQE